MSSYYIVAERRCQQPGTNGVGSKWYVRWK